MINLNKRLPPDIMPKIFISRMAVILIMGNTSGPNFQQNMLAPSKMSLRTKITHVHSTDLCVGFNLIAELFSPICKGYILTRSNVHT